MNILFTCAGRRNYLIQYFKKIIGDSGKTIAVDSDTMAPAFADADISITVPPLYDKSYMAALLEIINDYKVDLVIPLNDLELPIMASNKEQLQANGAKVIISDPDLIDLCSDKWRTYSFFKDLKIATPKTFIEIEDAIGALAENTVKFPMILKPRWGFGSTGIKEVDNEEELRLAYRLLLTKANKIPMASINDNSSKNQIIIQEKIDAEEYGIDIVNDFDGNYYGSYAKRKLAMRAGETDKALSVINSNFNKIAQKIGNATRHLGIMDCDFFLKDRTVYFLEMNPRFGGGYPFSHQAGLNLPGIYLEWLKGNSEVSGYDTYRADCIFSKCDRIVTIRECKKPVGKNARMVV